jgi:tetratricopeptide (TPR) repeat protein
MDKWKIDKRGKEKTKTTENAKILTKGSLLIAFVIFSLALTIRFIYLYESSANPSFQTPIVDSKTYDRIARAFAEGQGIGFNFFWQPFFYPFFLSVVYFFSGGSIICAKVFQLLLGALTCVLTYKLGEKIFNRWIGIIAGIITVFYGPMFFYEAELLSTSWATFWAVVVILLFLKTKEKDKGWHWFFLGLCGALSIITRPEFFPIFIAGCIWLRFQVHRGLSIVFRFGAILLGIVLVTVPVGVASKYVTGNFSIVPFSGGLNLYIGNNPNYCQTLTIRPGSEDWEKLIRLPSKYGVRNNVNDVWDDDRFFKQQVMEYAKSQPLNFAKGLGRKTLEFICSREIPRNVSIYVLGRWSRLLRLLAWKVNGFGFPFGLIFPLAVLGLIFNWRRIPLPVILFTVLYPLPIILVFVASRYRVPMVPILAILATAGLVSVVERFRLRKWRELIIIVTMVAGMVLLSTLPGPFCQEQVNFEVDFFQLVGWAMSSEGRNDEAMVCFSKALSLNPECPETHYYMGRALLWQGKVTEAIKHYREALRLKPDYITAHGGLSVALQLQGKLDEAIEHYKEAVRLKPDYPEVYLYLGVALQLQGKLDGAIEHFREALRLKPDYPEVHYNLGVVLELQGKLDEAIEHYRVALSLNPDFHEARKRLSSAMDKQRKSKDAFNRNFP